ncbi:hypothetical protein [Kitasatospora sp. NPDC004289]
MSNPYQQPPPDPYGGYGQQPHPHQAYPGPGYPQQHQQPQPGYPMGPMAPVGPVAEPNGMANAALALGFASIVICFYGALLGPVGLGLGIAGLNRSQRTGVGRTQAIGGIVLSALGLLIGIAGLVFYETVAENYVP